MGRQITSLADLCSYWQIFWNCTRQSAIRTECANELIEIVTSQNALLLHFEIEFVAGSTIFGCINKDVKSL